MRDVDHALAELQAFAGANGSAIGFTLLGAMVIFFAVALLFYRCRRANVAEGPVSAGSEQASGTNGEVTFAASQESKLRDVGLRPLSVPTEPNLVLGIYDETGHRSGVLIDEQIASAEHAGNQNILATLYLEHAVAELGRERVVEAAVALRKCVRAAERARVPLVHAKARLELAEMARREGDLITACEHWQIARRLFADSDDRVASHGAEALMLRHGCPTDWVLNHF